MLNLPYETIVQKIKEKSGLSEEEISSKINEKLTQLSGLISKEGAAHIVANEFGVKLLEEFTGKLKIKNILQGIRNLETVGKVTGKTEIREFKTANREGKVASFVLADETGNIKIVMWGSMAEKVKEINIGDVVKIAGGYVKENNAQKEVHLNERSLLTINPEGETVDVEVKSNAGGRKKISELAMNDSGVELLGHIVQVFIPTFYEVCPDCSRRIKPGVNGFVCDTHGKKDPDYSYVMNLVLDDGTETIRTVFFRQQVEKLLKKSREDMAKLRQEPEEVNILKNSLMGSLIKIKGNVNNNAMFARMEFVVDDVVYGNAEEELQKMEKGN